MKVISIMTEKGGTGKSTGAREIAGILKNDFKVLLVDLDFQQNLTSSLDFEKDNKNIYDAMLNEDFKNNIVNVMENLDIIPGDIRMRHINDDIKTSITAEYIIREQIKELNYDYIILDCRPDMNIAETNALLASDIVLTPVEPHNFSLEGFDILEGYIQSLQNQIKSNLIHKGYLSRVPSDKTFLEGIQALISDYEKDLLETRVRENVKLKEASVNQEFIVDYSPRSNGAVDFKKLVEEVVKLG